MANIVGVAVEEKEKNIVVESPVEVKPVFKISFSCRNCGDSFDRQFGKGIEVSYSERGCWTTFNEKSGRYIKCENCNSERININHRLPIK